MDGSRARALLRVRPHASADEIRRAFRGAARAAHPDRGGDAAAFRALVSARDVLLASAGAARARQAWDVTAPARPTIDLTDIARRRVAPSPETPAPDFDAVLATVLAA